MLQRGIHQWEIPCPPDVLECIKSETQKGNVYLIKLPTLLDPIGTLRLEWVGSPYWPNETDAGYLRALAIKPSHMRQHFGETAITWALDYVRKQGKHRVRLECISSNHRLRQYYEDLGFVLRGSAVAGHSQISLYELPL